jgi:hypothetical protein
MRDPYPHHEPMAYHDIDADVPSGKALVRGLVVVGVILILLGCLWA